MTYEYIKILWKFTIKTHSNESHGQERAKWIAENKMQDKLLHVFYTSEYFPNMMS